MLFNRMKGILSYELKGKYGWSSYQPNVIDIADIISLSYCKRLFCIFDGDLPYTLNIECHNISTETSLAPAITSTGIGLAFIPRNKFKSIITRRFKTIADIENEINTISAYQSLLDKHASKIRNELINKS